MLKGECMKLLGTRFFSLAVGIVSLGSMAGSAFGWQGELPAWATERKIIGPNNLEKIEKANGSTAYKFALPIARFEDTSGEGLCTAWRVADNLFVTNYHCYEALDCNQVVFHLGTEDKFPKNKQQHWKCEKVLHQIEEFDYAIYEAKLMDNEPGDASSFPTIALWGGKLEVGQKLILSGHPGARTKEIDRSDDCKIKTTTIEVVEKRKTITHTCDSEGGSSGSPVLDRATGAAVALHWGGESTRNFAIPMYLIVENMKKELDADVFAQLTIKGAK